MRQFVKQEASTSFMDTLPYFYSFAVRRLKRKRKNGSKRHAEALQGLPWFPLSVKENPLFPIAQMEDSFLVSENQSRKTKVI